MFNVGSGAVCLLFIYEKHIMGRTESFFWPHKIFDLLIKYAQDNGIKSRFVSSVVVLPILFVLLCYYTCFVLACWFFAGIFLLFSVYLSPGNRDHKAIFERKCKIIYLQLLLRLFLHVLCASAICYFSFCYVILLFRAYVFFLFKVLLQFAKLLLECTNGGGLEKVACSVVE